MSRADYLEFRKQAREYHLKECKIDGCEGGCLVHFFAESREVDYPYPRQDEDEYVEEYILYPEEYCSYKNHLGEFRRMTMPSTFIDDY
jgi:hypothetical protein